MNWPHDIPENDSRHCGEIAGGQWLLFGENSRYKVAPVHGMAGLEWWVWDAETMTDETLSPKIVCVDREFEQAVAAYI